MEIQIGQVVKSITGRDKGAFLTVIQLELPYVLLCDGKRRKLINPKRKKIMHLAMTKVILDGETLETNKRIRSALSTFGQTAKGVNGEVTICQNRT